MWSKNVDLTKRNVEFSVKTQCENCRNSLSHFFRESNCFYQRSYVMVDLTKFLLCDREFLVFHTVKQWLSFYFYSDFSTLCISVIYSLKCCFHQLFVWNSLTFFAKFRRRNRRNVFTIRTFSINKREFLIYTHCAVGKRVHYSIEKYSVKSIYRVFHYY